jgi:hypothetical protein
MANAKLTMGNFGASTSPISFAPAIKSNKEALLKKFREQLGRKGYSPAEAAAIAAKVRADGNALAVEVNAREGNDDRVRMANIHTMALKMKISDALKSLPKKTMGEDDLIGRISKTSPMSVSIADEGKVYDTTNVLKRSRIRDRKKEAKVYDMVKYRKARGAMKDSILREAMRASYMQQFNGSMGHYYGGTMGFRFKKPKFIAKAQKAVAKAAAPIKKVAAVVSKPIVQASKYTAKSVVRAAQIVKKDPIGALAKVTVAAPFTVIASIAPKNTVIGKAARKAEAGTVKVVKASFEFLKKILDKIKDLVVKALQPVINFFKKAWEKVKSVIIEKVAARFIPGGLKGFGSLPEQDKKKLTDMTTDFLAKKALEAAGVEATILGTATAAAISTATPIVTAAAGAGGPAAPATAAAAAPGAAATGATAATPAATGATTSYMTRVAAEGVNEVGIGYAKYKAQKEIPNPILRKVVDAGIDGKIPTDAKSVKAMATTLPQQARKEFVKRVEAAPQALKQEIIKKTIIPTDFKKAADYLPKEAKALAAGKPAIPQIAIAEAMQKSYAKDPKVKDISPAQAKVEAAKGVLVQDQLAVNMVKEGKLNMTQAIVASSKIGKEAAIAKLPPEVRKEAVAEVKKEMSHVEVARIEEKQKEEKSKNTTAILAAAAIAAKVLLF